MRFKLPKPLHGWREFVGEVGIIVLGVLIALGAQQLVESWQWRQEVQAERASLLKEVSDVLSIIAVRDAQVPCVDQRLAEIHTILERHRRGEPLGLIRKISHPTQASASTGTWQIALAGQALTHMPHDEKLAFSDAFGGFDGWDRAAQREREVWLRLSPLNSADLLTEEDWSGIRSAYAQAKDINDVVRVGGPFTIKHVERELAGAKPYADSKAGIPPPELQPVQSFLSQVCAPLLAPSEKNKSA
jgi:hypothetical protein